MTVSASNVATVSTGSQAKLIGALGITQILGWGTTFYLLAVLAAPIARDTGWALALVVAGVSWGLLISGTCSPRVGRLIDRFGGRSLLSASSLLIALGLFLMSQATHPAFYFLAWTILGMGMAAGLYDAAFATLGHLLGEAARPAITGLTLLGGFASTAAWPTLVALEEQLGWRGACEVVALVHLLLGFPIHYWLIPVPERTLSQPSHRTSTPVPRKSIQLLNDKTFLTVAVVFTLLAFVMSGLSVHLLDMLRQSGLDPVTVVAVGMVIGPAQVLARMVEFTLGRGLHPIWSAHGGMLLCLFGIALLLIAGPQAAFIAIAMYGAGNGIMTITRGTLPLALFGSVAYGERMGVLARPMLIAQASAPILAAIVLERFGVNVLLAVFTGLVLLGSAGLFFIAHRPPA